MQKKTKNSKNSDREGGEAHVNSPLVFVFLLFVFSRKLKFSSLTQSDMRDNSFNKIHAEIQNLCKGHITHGMLKTF